MSKTKRNALLVSLAIGILLSVSVVIHYRKTSWQISDGQRMAFINECSNYGSAAFCDCFLTDLNKKLPADKIIELTKHNTVEAREVERQSVNACKEWE